MPVPEAGPDEGGWDPWGEGGWDEWAGWHGGDQFPGWLSGGRGYSERRLAYMAQMLPYLQAYQQAGQWGEEFDWRQEMDRWSQAFQGGQFDWQQQQDLWGRGLQEQMFGSEEAGRLWGQGFQEEQFGWQQEIEGQRLRAEQESANLAAFGRRWKPSTRWT